MTLDPDVAAKVRISAAKYNKPVKAVVNAALRIGLEEMSKIRAKPYKTKAHPLNLKPGLSYDNIAELIALAEGENNP